MNPRPCNTWLGRSVVTGVSALVTAFAVITAYAQQSPFAPTTRTPSAVPGPAVPATAGAPAEESEGLRLNFNMAPVDLLLQEYAQKTGRTLLLAPTLPTANITLRNQGRLTLEEFLEAIETVLGMNGIALLPEGDKFIRVVPNKQAREEPMPITTDPGEERPDKSKVISQMIAFKHIEAPEAQKIIQPLLHSYAQVHVFEGINSLLITDTAANLNRVTEVVVLIDQPIEAREETIVVQIRYAKASEIKSKLEQIIAESQEEQQQKSSVQRPNDAGSPGVTPAAGTPTTPPGVIRARRATAEATADVVEAAERGLIRGKVKIIDDDRTNILILITRPENMVFFEKIIQVLDVETSPDVLVRVFRLEYAEAKDIAGMLNDLIGAASSKDDTDASTVPGAESGAGEGGEEAPERYSREGTALRDFVEQRQAAQTATQTTTQQSNRKSKVGELSTENIKILSDERTNALIIMGSKADVSAIEDIIRDMDLMLSQVLVEAVIVEINLDDSLQSGVDWVQRALITYNDGPNGALQPKVAYAGGGGGGALTPLDPTTLTTTESLAGRAGAGLNYYLTLFDLNVDMVFKAVATDSRTRILSSPIILTTDNKEATIDVSQATYFFKGQRPVQAGNVVEYTEDVEREDVGIKLTVKPRINEKHFVVMEIDQTLEDVTGSQRIGDTDWPIVTKRNVEAEVAVKSGDTIVLGGLVKTTDTRSKSGIPFLGDIPILGLPFRSSNKGKKRQEVIVFITPYVLNTPNEMMADAVRRQDAMGAYGIWKRGWSNSKLAEPRMLGQLQDLGTARDELGYDAQKTPSVDTNGARPFQSHEGSLLNGTPPAGAPIQELPVAPAVAPAVTAPEVNAPVAAAEPEVLVERPEGQHEEDWDPMGELDPELRRYVEQEDKKYDKVLKKVDRTVEKEGRIP